MSNFRETKIKYIQKRLATPSGRKKLVNELIGQILDVDEMGMETFIQHFKENLELLIDIAMENPISENQKVIITINQRFKLLDL